MLVPISAPDSAQRCRCAEIAHGCDGHGPRRVADTQGRTLSRLMPIWDLLLLCITQPTTAMPKVNSPFNRTSRREYRLAHPCIFFLYLDRKLAISRITYSRVWPQRGHIQFALSVALL